MEVVYTNNEVAAKSLMQNNYLAVTILLAVEKQQHGKILRDLENNYIKGENHYPTDVSATFNYLTNDQG